MNTNQNQFFKKTYSKSLILKRFTPNDIPEDQKVKQYKYKSFQQMLSNNSMGNVGSNDTLNQGTNEEELKFIYWQLYLNNLRQNRYKYMRVMGHPDITHQDIDDLGLKVSRIPNFTSFTILFATLGIAWQYFKVKYRHQQKPDMRIFGAMFLILPGSLAKGVHMWATNQAEEFVESSGMVEKYKIKNIEQEVLGDK